jgi:hypothetical protein
MRFLSARVSSGMPLMPLGWRWPRRECFSLGAMYRAAPSVLSRSTPVVGRDEPSAITAFPAIGWQNSVAAAEITIPTYN